MAEIRVEALQALYDGTYRRAVSNYQGPISSAKGLNAAVEELKADVERRVKEKSMQTAMSVDTTVDITMSNEEFEDLLKAERKKVWELVSKIATPVSEGGYTGNELVEIFDTSNPAYLFHKFSAEEALKKVEAYENGLKVGDEVEIEICDATMTGYVIKISQFSFPDVVVITVPKGSVFWVKGSEVKKTGRHSDALEKCIKEVITNGKEDK